MAKLVAEVSFPLFRLENRREKHGKLTLWRAGAVVSDTRHSELFRVLLRAQDDSVRWRNLGLFLRVHRRRLLLFRVRKRIPLSLSSHSTTMLTIEAFPTQAALVEKRVAL